MKIDLDKKYREKIQYILKETPSYIDRVFELEMLLKEHAKEQLSLLGVVKSLKDKNTPNLREWAKLNGYEPMPQKFIKDGQTYDVGYVFSNYIGREENL